MARFGGRSRRGLLVVATKQSTDDRGVLTRRLGQMWLRPGARLRRYVSCGRHLEDVL
jgi:hypothetical protein